MAFQFFLRDQDDILGRTAILSAEKGLLGLGQILRPDGSWVYRTLDTLHDAWRISERA